MPSFSEEFEEEFLDEVIDELGDDLTWISGDDTNDFIDFQGIFSSKYKGSDMGLIVDIEGHNVQCYISQIPEIKHNDTIINNVTNKNYKVDSVQPKGDGWIVVILSYEN